MTYKKKSYENRKSHGQCSYFVCILHQTYILHPTKHFEKEYHDKQMKNRPIRKKQNKATVRSLLHTQKKTLKNYWQTCGEPVALKTLLGESKQQSKCEKVWQYLKILNIKVSMRSSNPIPGYIPKRTENLGPHTPYVNCSARLLTAAKEGKENVHLLMNR